MVVRGQIETFFLTPSRCRQNHSMYRSLPLCWSYDVAVLTRAHARAHRACARQDGMANEQRVGEWPVPSVCRRLLVEATDGHAEPRASDFHALPN